MDILNFKRVIIVAIFAVIIVVRICVNNNFDFAGHSIIAAAIRLKDEGIGAGFFNLCASRILPRNVSPHRVAVIVCLDAVLKLILRSRRRSDVDESVIGETYSRTFLPLDELLPLTSIRMLPRTSS